MKQPVLVVLNVPEGTEQRELQHQITQALNDAPRTAWLVDRVIPLSYTLDVPQGALSD